MLSQYPEFPTIAKAQARQRRENELNLVAIELVLVQFWRAALYKYSGARVG
jgi:hypothetical protein